MDDDILAGRTRHALHHNALVVVVSQASGIARASYAGIGCHSASASFDCNPDIICSGTGLVIVLVNEAVTPRNTAGEGYCKL